MDLKEPERIDEEAQAETPEDVAVLYSWANLQGAKYRDFSASRREFRAQMRQRAAEAQRESERRGQMKAESAAEPAERGVREAEDTARAHEHAAHQAEERAQPGQSRGEEEASVRALRVAAELARKASAEREEAARRAEAAAAAEAAARREQREASQAHSVAEGQARAYGDWETRRRTLAGPQPIPPGTPITDPYGIAAQPAPERAYPQLVVAEDDMQPSRFPQAAREPRAGVLAVEGAGKDAPGEVRGEKPVVATEAPAPTEAERHGAESPRRDREKKETRGDPDVLRPMPWSERRAKPRPAFSAAGGIERRAGLPVRAKKEQGETEEVVPAWIYSKPQPTPERIAHPVEPGNEAAKQPREPGASRWFALNNALGPADQARAAQPQGPGEMRVPLLTVFSLAGGVGKTTLVATLGRALSSMGERVLLADTTPHGLLPFYFGAKETRAGVVRTFSPPPGSPDAPIHTVSYDASQTAGGSTQDRLVEELVRNSLGTQRVLFDLSACAAPLVRSLARLNPIFLVPVAPDLNSVVSLKELEKIFAGVVDATDRPMKVFYLLSNFNAAVALHTDVREVLRQELGEKLLPIAVRCSPAVPEALAEGMTVMDYAHDSAVAADYMNVVSWLQTQSAPAAAEFRHARWSER